MFAETLITMDGERLHVPEDPIVYGQKVAELVVQNGWVSPNYMHGRHWAKMAAMRKQIRDSVGLQVAAMSLTERDRAVLREPEARVLRLTLYQLRGAYPDVDNLVAGWKHLIDALKKVQYRRVPTSVGRKVYSLEQTLTGVGLIWNDAPKYLRIAEIHCCRCKDSPYNMKTGYYGVCEVFEWPEEQEGS